MKQSPTIRKHDRLKVILHEGYEHLRGFVESLPEQFESDGKVLWAARNTVKSFMVDGTEIIVKRYKQPNPVQKIAYSFFCPGKAERAYRYADMLLQRGVATPAPVAYITTSAYGLLNDSFFLSTAIHDSPLYDELVNKENFDRELARELALFMVKLHEQGIMHGDPNLNNILYRRDGDATSFSLIDTNRSEFASSLSRSQCISNLKRLTHRRDLLQYIVEWYAAERGWDISLTVTAVLDSLKRFEHRRARKYRLKRLLKL